MADRDERGSQRSRLLGVKLRALVGEHRGRPVDGEPARFTGGAALVVDDAAWVIADGPAGRALGGALGWAIRNGATSLNLVAETETGRLARRAARFEFPIAVWFAEERSLLPAPPEPLPPPPPASVEHLAFRSLIEEAGADPNVEHGVVFGEVLGLEVCRVVDRPTIGRFAEPEDPGLVIPPAGAEPPPARPTGVQLEVGVGENDREAFQLLHGDIPTPAALAAVVDVVRAHRSVDAPQHPLNRLAGERLLRWRAEHDPSLAGFSELRRAEPPVPRPNVKDPTPCVAGGRSTTGERRLAVFSSGVDLDLIPYVADVQATADDPVTVVLPARDLVPLTSQLAALLATPVDFVTLG